MSQYIDVLIKEFDMRVSEILGTFSTIYIGGGTPSILPIVLLNKLVKHISKYVNINTLDEFTI
ncbi:MAG: coproporphyrinogen III oxidase, partial [Muribaculaceae bacterium]|nr:coproporphyrinogen III oxidase [Muribaculaceae bacterium]